MSEQPTILAIDTTLEACSAGLLINGKKITASEPMARGQTERLVPMVQELCAEKNVALGDLDALAVTLGPGSFTGVRVGLAAAQGIAFALSIPLYGYSTLEAISKTVKERPLTVAVDTKRGEVFTQDFAADGSAGSAQITNKDDFAKHRHKVLLTNAVEFDGKKITAESVLNALLDMAEADLKGKKQISVNDLEPIYLREAEVAKSKINYREIKT